MRIYRPTMARCLSGVTAVFIALLLVACIRELGVGKGRGVDGDVVNLHYAAAYGDSTTQGDGVSVQDRWTALLAAQTGWTIDNFGANGQKSEQIAARWGSVAPVGTPEGGVIPASGPVALKLDIDPIQSKPDNRTLEVDLRVDDGSVIRGTLSRSANHCVFTRADVGSAVATSRVEVHAVIPDQRRRGLLIIGMGINNETNLDNGIQTLAQIEDWYVGMTRLHRGHLMVWGVLDRGISEAPGTARGDYIAALESWLAKEYGAEFVPVRQYLSSQRALDDAARVSPGFAPTVDDLSCVAVGCVPPSFRVASGSVHLNKLGHQLQARLFYQYMSSPNIGWIK